MIILDISYKLYRKIKTAKVIFNAFDKKGKKKGMCVCKVLL